MNNHELTVKVHSFMYRQCRSKGYATAVDVLMDIGVLQKDKYEDWRFGHIPYLERVCTINLSKLSTIRHQMRVYAQKAGLKPSFCYYKQWGAKKKGGQGRKPVIPLRFSKYGKPEIEKQYATPCPGYPPRKVLRDCPAGQENRPAHCGPLLGRFP